MSSIVLEQKFKIVENSGQETTIDTQEIKENFKILDVVKRSLDYSAEPIEVVNTTNEYDYVDFRSDIPVAVEIMQGLTSIFSGNTMKYTAIGSSNSGQYVIRVQNLNESKKANLSIILAKEA